MKRKRTLYGSISARVEKFVRTTPVTERISLPEGTILSGYHLGSGRPPIPPSPLGMPLMWDITTKGRTR